MSHRFIGTASAGARTRRGISLIELVVVVMIIGIIAAVAQPRFTSALSASRANAAARRLAADLDYAATLARVSSKPVLVEFFAGGTAGPNYYRFREVANPHIPGRPMDPSNTETWYTVTLSAEPYAATIESAPSSITYSFEGFPSLDAQIIVSAGAQQRTIAVTRTSEKAVIQ